MDQTEQQMKDHDTLIRIETRVEDLIKSVESIKSGTAVQIADHEKRIKALEMSRSNQKISMAIYIGIGAFLAGLMIYHMIGK